MIVSSASNAPTCIIHVGDDELHIPENEDLILAHCDKLNFDLTINSACQEPHKACHKNMDRREEVKDWNEILKTHWREELALPDGYSANRKKIINMLR